MSSYLQKFRRQSRQLIPRTESNSGATKAPGPSNTETSMKDEEVGNPSGAPRSPPVPTVTEPSEIATTEPALDEEDEKFIKRLAEMANETEESAPALPARSTEASNVITQQKTGKNAQEALMDGAHQIELPLSPPDEVVVDNKGKTTAKDGSLNRRKSVMSYFTMPKFGKKDGEKEKEKTSKDKKQTITTKDKEQLANDLHSAAEAAKTAQLTEEQKEGKELTDVLDQLNLSAVNNRVFSFSKESEELLNKFIQILKDLVNGVPTAYNDLENLFRDYDNQLRGMYGGLPPFMQNLVKSLPAKLGAILAPELLAASAEKPGFEAQAASGVKSKKMKIPSVPSLKQLLASQGAVTTALRSIMNFLKFRFPAIATGTNLILGVAVFLLLFVFWYCYKRGREVRLENERRAAEEVDKRQGSSSLSSSMNDDADSIFGERTKKKAISGEKAVPQPPLVASDGKEEPSVGVEALPSVSHLPSPTSVESDKPILEAKNI